MGRRFVDELPSEVTLHPANKVVMTRMSSFAVQLNKEQKRNIYKR
jgi:hypothetical protein